MALVHIDMRSRYEPHTTTTTTTTARILESLLLHVLGVHLDERGYVVEIDAASSLLPILKWNESLASVCCVCVLLDTPKNLK